METLTFPVAKYRIESIDILRGLIMLIMAIDHTRDFFHAGSPNPVDMSTTTPILFFTRWITHYCAAMFVFLSGVSANLAGTRRTKKQLSLFLIKRGFWLIVVECVLITFALTLDPFFHLFIFQVIWVIGVSMILLGILIWLPLTVIAIIGAVLFFGHDLLYLVELPTQGIAGFLWQLFFTAFVAFKKIDDTHFILILYALLPWTGVMLMGYVLGEVYHLQFNKIRRKRIIMGSGIVLLILFVILRAFNLYGDPNPWMIQKTTVLSILSFLNVSKYPPSLLYLCMTIGPGLILLSLFEKTSGALSRLLIIYGNVPFFYYVLHFYLLRILNILLFFLQGYTMKDMGSTEQVVLFRPQEFGFNLLGVYIIWLVVIAMLYLPCRWFSYYKKTHHHWWLSYI